MTLKKERFKLAKIIRKQTGIHFMEAKKLAKAFLRGDMQILYFHPRHEAKDEGYHCDDCREHWFSHHIVGPKGSWQF